MSKNHDDSEKLILKYTPYYLLSNKYTIISKTSTETSDRSSIFVIIIINSNIMPNVVPEIHIFSPLLNNPIRQQSLALFFFEILQRYEKIPVKRLKNSALIFSRNSYIFFPRASSIPKQILQKELLKGKEEKTALSHYFIVLFLLIRHFTFFHGSIFGWLGKNYRHI